MKPFAVAGVCIFLWSVVTADPAMAEHVHTAPHGGALNEVGEEAAHVELVVDAEQGKLTAYLLDGEAEGPVLSAQPAITLELICDGAEELLQLDLSAVANPLTGESVGRTSEFAAVDAALRDAKACRGTVSELRARGETFSDIPVSFPEGTHAGEAL